MTTQTTLDRILDATRARVAALRDRRDALASAAAAAPDPAPWRYAFTRDDVAVVAEVKRRSPSAGAIALDLDPVRHAAAYERGGAAAVSVLTEAAHFGGSLDDLKHVRAAVTLPLLRKDFIIDPVQLYEARLAGASAVLLIVRALGDTDLRRLMESARTLGLACVVEVHSEAELDRAVGHAPDTIGVNARNLETFDVSPTVVERLLPQVPEQMTALAESGMSSRADVERVAAWGADAVLVGTALATSADAAQAVRALTGVARRRPKRGAPA